MNDRKYSDLNFNSRSKIRVSSFDRVASFLYAMLILVSTIVVLLVLIWIEGLGKQTEFRRIDPTGEQIGQSSTQTVLEIDEPKPSEFPEAAPTTLEHKLISVVQAVMAQDENLVKYQNSGYGKGLWSGPDRIPGPDPDPSPEFIEPESNRWIIEYAPDSRASYFEMLEFFDVTLGAVSRTTNRIDYLDHLTDRQPTTHRGVRKNEKRLYFLNSNVRLRLWEKAIFDQSGVDTSDKLIVQFYDDSLRRKLREVEQAKLDERGRQLAEISQTVFYVEQRSSEFEIKVRQFDFRAPKDNRDDL